MQNSVAVNECGYRIGEDHHNSRYTDSEVEMVLTLRDEGLSYGEIMRMMEIPKSTVRDICKARRRCQTAVWLSAYTRRRGEDRRQTARADEDRRKASGLVLLRLK